MHSNTHEPVILARSCEAIEIPSGRKIELFQGTNLTIIQALGGSYTVMTEQGAMASIAGKDADAVGKPVPPPIKIEGEITFEAVEKLVWQQLKTCYDPEIPHNIVDLGLVYECLLVPTSPESHQVQIKMTLTAQGCGMGDWLRSDVKSKVANVPGVQEVNVDLVFDPPWDRSKMHPALKREYGV